MITIWGDLPSCAWPLQPWAEKVDLGDRSLHPIPPDSQGRDLDLQHLCPLYLPLPPCVLGKALPGYPADQIHWTQLWLQFLISFLL